MILWKFTSCVERAWSLSETESPVEYVYATSTFPIMHLICPPKFCITFIFHFSWVSQPSQEKLKTMLTQNFFWGGGGANKVHYGKCGSGVYKFLVVAVAYQQTINELVHFGFPRKTRARTSIGQGWINTELQSTPHNPNLEGKSEKVRFIGSSKKIAGSKEKNSFYCTVNILITFNCRKVKCTDNWKILLDYKSERNVTKRCLKSMRFTVLRSRIFETFVVKFLACLPLLGFSNI